MLITILFILLSLNKNYKACPYMDHYENGLMVQKIITDFSEFNKLDFQTCHTKINITALRLKPSRRIILDNTLDFTGLKLNVLSQFFLIVLNNIKGIDLKLIVSITWLYKIFWIQDILFGTFR